MLPSWPSSCLGFVRDRDIIITNVFIVNCLHELKCICFVGPCWTGGVFLWCHDAATVDQGSFQSLGCPGEVRYLGIVATLCVGGGRGRGGAGVCVCVDRPVTMGPDWAKASRSPVVGLSIEKCVCVCARKGLMVDFALCDCIVCQ